MITADEQAARRQKAAAEGHRRRGAGAGRLRQDQNVIVYKRTGGSVSPGRPAATLAGTTRWPARATSASRSGSVPSTRCFLLYTSGFDRQAQGRAAQHRRLPAARRAVTTKWTFDLKPDDVFWCTADIGWVTGHTYITYGPLALGGTEIVFEGVPTYPDAGRFWKMIQDHRSPSSTPRRRRSARSSRRPRPTRPCTRRTTTSRACASSARWASRSTRRPGMWYHQHVGGGRCPIVDTFWQTETGGHMITPLPGATRAGAGFVHAALPGHPGRGRRRDRQAEVPWGQGGILVVKRPWPSMIRTIWGDPSASRRATTRKTSRGKLLPRRRRRHPRRRPATSPSPAASTTC